MFHERELGDLTIKEISWRLEYMTLKDIGIILLVIGCVVVFSAFIMIMLESNKKQKGDLVQHEMKAQVVDKMQVNPGESVYIIWVVFETEDGNRIKLTCSAENDYNVGDIGYLKWQGSDVITFGT